MTNECVKGFRDIEGAEAERRVQIRNIIGEIFKRYNFMAVETPVIEYEEFVRGNNSADEAVSDIFKLQDRGERKLALRYEFTFQLKRLALNKKLPYKRYEMGYVFRDEPIAGNRFRQFTQCDADIIGSSLREEAEILSLASLIFEKLGIKVIINVNNRKLLNEILEKAGVSEKNKPEVIREIDKLDKLSEVEVKANLKKYSAEKILEILGKPEKTFEKYSSYKEIVELKKACLLYGIKINFVPFLARGLSYYNGSVFEIKNSDKDEMKETICAGGSYLVNGIQATGISFGLDRLEKIAKLKVKDKARGIVVSIGEDKVAVKLAEALRENNVACSVMFGKMSKALEYANSYSLDYAIFVGPDEVKKKKFTLRNMKTGNEQLLSEKDIIEKLSN
jgi:histidyl-tRNA synthetase